MGHPVPLERTRTPFSLAGDVGALAHDAVLFGEALDAPHEALLLPVRRALLQSRSQELPPL